MNMALEIAELKRKLGNLIIDCNVAELDESKHRLKVTWGETAEDTITSGWLPWPADIGLNYKRWKPLRMGQPLIIACPSGDTAQARIIAELYSDALSSPSEDPLLDVVSFDNGNVLQHNASGGAMKIIAKGGVDLTGDLRITGGVISTKDQVADGVSQINHVHEKTASHPILKSGKPDR